MENKTHEYGKWIAGILISIILSVTAYSINLNLENEKRITTIETDLTQAKSELDAIWEKYNKANEGREMWIVKFGDLQSRIAVIETEIKDLKK